ncbi:MAG: glycosyltransferase [Patescibacteria group bacterium]
MAKKYFSIIIPCLNEEKYLPKLLGNLAKQNFTDFEVLVVDGNSQDRTIKEAKKFTKNLALKTIATTVRNASTQRNLGAKNATSDRLIFFDADTQIPKSFLKNVYSCFENDKPDLLTTWTKTNSKLETDKAIAMAMNVLFEIGKFVGSPALLGCFIAVTKSAFNSAGGFDEDMKFAEDSDLGQKILSNEGKFVILRSAYYYISLRRYKKEGTLKTFRQQALLGLNRFLKFEKFTKLPEYAMGGHVFEKHKRTESLAWVQATLNSFSQKKNIAKIKNSSGLKFLTALVDDIRKV